MTDRVLRKKLSLSPLHQELQYQLDKFNGLYSGLPLSNKWLSTFVSTLVPLSTGARPAPVCTA